MSETSKHLGPNVAARARRVTAAAIAGLAVGVIALGTVCLARSHASPKPSWQGGWGSANGWWGPGWWGTGRFVSVLPWDYQSFWWQGKPYYFGGATFYAWNGDVGKYEEVTPPIGFNQPLSTYVQMSNGIPKLSRHLFAYPAAGQSPAEQARDESECLRLASTKDAPHAPPKPVAKPVVRRGPPGRRPPPGARRGPRRRPASAPIPAAPVDTLAMQHALLHDEATCLEKRHYVVR